MTPAIEELARFTTATRTIGADDVAAFAELTGDHHPQHTDPGWAAESVFGEQVAHGLLVLSCAAGLVPFDPERVVALRAVRDVVFKRPVHFGDPITVEGRLGDVDAVTGIRPVKLNIKGADGRTVARATLEVVWRSDADR